MPLKDALKVTRKTFFNPTGWLGLNSIKTQFSTNWQIIKSLYVTPTAVRKESFEEAKQRFELTDEKIEEISKQFLLFTTILVTCGVITILFSLYLLFTGVYAGFIIGLATAAVFWAYAFRYSFWRFEIRHRKLGCTFNEWWTGKLSPHKDTRDD